MSLRRLTLSIYEVATPREEEEEYCYLYTRWFRYDGDKL
jgi:hypothetical protein